MDKRYQVFVSSTFNDLKDERSHVFQTLMEMDCIPAGMELFPAIDEEQWEFIKKIIDDCDYYLLIIGGRYGSVAPDGLSYTEKEFDYAVEKGLKVTVLVHENPEELPAKNSELNSDSREKLTKFIEKCSNGRLRKTWSSVKDLPGVVSLSMQKTIKTYPAIGWVRADKVTNQQALEELNQLRKENAELHNRILELEKTPDFKIPENIASLDSYFEVHYKLVSHNISGSREDNTSITISWEELFSKIAPFINSSSTDNDVAEILIKYIKYIKPHSYSYTYIEMQDVKTIYIQFKSLGLIEYNDDNWILSQKGRDLMMNIRAIKN